MRATLKGARVAAHVFFGLITSLVLAVDGKGRFKRLEIAKRWQRRLLRILGVRVHVNGAPAAGARILIANHISWLDIPVIASIEATRFLSKAEVREWPVAGRFADTIGTLYIQRGAGATKQLVEEMAAVARNGELITFFPESTTTTGDVLLRFQSRLFEAAIAADCPIQPIVLRYSPTAQGQHIAPFVGDDDLLPHLMRLLRSTGLQVEVTYCEPISPTGLDRDALSDAAQNAVLRVLGLSGTSKRSELRTQLSAAA